MNLNDDINISFYKLRKKFKEIQPIYHISQRDGYTGLGYTFESLLGKEEDRNYYPDYLGIEIKTQAGYSKQPLTLFSLTPSSKDSIKMIYEKYSYPNTNNRAYKSFKGDAFCKKDHLIAFKYYFKLKVNYELKILQLFILNCYFEVIKTDIYWDFESLKERLYCKLPYLAYVKGYPYRIGGKIYYKYANMTFYKLKDFETFLELIEKDIIYVAFNIDTVRDGDFAGNIKDRGTAFRLRNECLEMLFDKIDL